MSAQPTTTTAPAPAPEGQVNIEIDGVALHAPKGSMIIQAADKAGIAIPRFCYHEKLPIAANCRMCMVETEMGGKPMPKPQPACATPVMDGMKIYTRSQRALSGQRNVMEFLLINHPLDCPICDQGGECELQDVALGYGRSVSRFAERKRVVADEDMGPLVATDMTRCIQCTRCVRFTAEIAGTYELGGMNRGENLEIGTYDGKPLTTELSGNVIDVCPVGALTNKVFRFRARAWELIARESIGYHDALGSNLYLHTRRGEVLRTVPRDNEAINECWLSDRDRYSHQGLTAADRATKPMVKDGDTWRECGWDEALERATEILKQHRGDALGVLVHPATSNEEGALLARLATGLDTGNIDHRIRHNDFADAPVAEAFGMKVADIESADAIVLIGCNPRTEMPLLAQRIRKAAKRGAKLYAINPVDFDLTQEPAAKRIVHPSQLAAAVQGIADGDDDIADDLENAKNVVVILGEIAETHPQASRIRASARALAAACDAKLNRLPQGANAVGLARIGVLPGKRDATAMLADQRAAYLIYGIEPGLDFAAATQARKALGAAKVVAFSHFACQSTRAVADVILPIGLLPEIEATLTNVDGIAQSTVAGGKLPADARPGWRVLRALGGQLGLPGFEFVDLTELRASVVENAAVSGNGIATTADASGQGFERIVTSPIYRVDAVLRRSPALQAHPLTRAACVTLHPDDAKASGIAAGVMAKVSDANGTATLPVEISARVAKGAVWIESCHGATAPLAIDGIVSVVGV